MFRRGRIPPKMTPLPPSEGVDSPSSHKNQPQASEPTSGKGKFRLLSGVLLLGILLFNPVGCAFLGAFIAMGHIRLTASKLQKPQIYEPVAKTLALYCQSDPSFFPKCFSKAWLPQQLAPLGDPYCGIEKDYAFVQMGGGFYHYGYGLKLDTNASTPASNVWQLFLDREASAPKLLTTLALAVTQHVAAGELEKLVVSGYDHSLKNGNLDAYQGKVLTQLRYGDTTAAARTCQEWIGCRPEAWLPHFTYAHVRCRRGETQVAAAEFEDWVRQHKNFAHCVYLALFQFREGRTNEALTGVRWALEQPFIESPGTSGNRFYLGQNGALIAYGQGDYDLALTLCDKMLSSVGQENWWRRKLLRLKTAALFMKNDQASALALMQQVASSIDQSSFGAESMARDDKAFHDALERKDALYVRDFRNCVDELDKWFSPFESDETGIHGPRLNLSTPFPKSWISDTIRPSKEE